MEILLIDIGALAVFFAFMAIVYWHGVSHEEQPTRRGVVDVSRVAAAAGSSGSAVAADRSRDTGSRGRPWPVARRGDERPSAWRTRADPCGQPQAGFTPPCAWSAPLRPERP